MIGLITFHWADDYGAMLQAYALKQYCSRYDDVRVIPYLPNRLQDRYRLIKLDSVENAIESFKQIAHIRRFSKRLRRRKNMLSFRKKYLTADSSIFDAENIPDYDENIDKYVVGSDQIWNPEITNSIADGYFCTFRENVKHPCRCIAYSASIGVERLDEAYDEVIGKMLCNFDEISVREASSAPYISELYGKNVSSTLDPVFLPDRSEWLSVLPQVKKSAPYIFVYYTERNMQLMSYVEQLSNEKGLEILVFNQELRNKWTKPVCSMSTSSPLEFVAYMNNAEYVVTNSFHGLAFSVILQKQSAVFAHSGLNSRLNSLINAAELNARVVTDLSTFDIDSPIDWASSSKSLDKQIYASRQYLDKCLNDK